MRFFKNRSATHYSFARVLLLSLSALFITPSLALPSILVLMFSRELGAFLFAPLFALSWVWIFMVGFVVIRPRILRLERSLFGDDQFFSMYPREYRKEVARWRKASAFLNGVNSSDEFASYEDELPALLRMRRELSPEQLERIGITIDDAFFNGNFAEALEIKCLKYDRIYYSKHPLMLKHELRLINIKRSLFLLLKNQDMPVDPYESRLIELRNELAAAGSRVLSKEEKSKKNSSTNYSYLRAVGKYCLMFSLIPIIGFPYGYVIIHAHALTTPAYLILKVLAFSLVPISGLIVLKPIYLRAERYMLGDEAFFERHPHLYRKEVARWRKVSAHLNGPSTGESELLPGLLQIKRELTEEDASRFGVNMAASTADGSPSYESGLELNIEKYDRLYYGRHPRRIEKELRSIKVKRAFSLIFKDEDLPRSSYESRLYELKDEFCAPKAA